MEYKIAPFYSRNDKMKFAFHNLGVPVFTSTVLTIGTCLPMLFSDLVFLYKCSIVVLATLAASFAIGYLFFSATLHIIGPQEKTCDVPLYRMATSIAKFMINNRCIKSIEKKYNFDVVDMLSVYKKIVIPDKKQTDKKDKETESTSKLGS